MSSLDYSLNRVCRVPQDIFFQLHPSGNWVIYNVFTQDSLAVTTPVLDFLRLLEENKTLGTVVCRFKDEQFLIWDIGIFSQETSPLADPTRMIRNVEQWPAPLTLSVSSLITLLEKKHMLVFDEEKYRRLFAVKNSFLDREHLGNFHQQIGYKLVFEQKIDPSDWWAKQKFSSDQTQLNDTLYKAVQGHFLHSFFASRLSPSSKVIDLGCGIGYYTRQMAETGAEVLGVDPNEKYITLAQQKSTKVLFRKSKIGGKGDLDWIPSQSADFIFMIDALSFYFVPATFITAGNEPKPDIAVLFSDIQRILKPGGSFISVEPNGLFLFRPWFGEIERPYTIITEYNKPWYSVVQNYSQAIDAFIKHGFIIKDMKDLPVDEEHYKVNPRGTSFAREFPLWCFFELVPLSHIVNQGNCTDALSCTKND